ncbi:hypothetical protein H0H81_003243 [Sphagnurus paluster]|uniref:Uncharacterized protein n=1 Tax=Sphagnurus paluster TaxID=117069 RepID=A0A9P7GP56_9AGAR|nr:hypothetical protein H0H81_003243 [Sphagnurus paluster]
MAVSYRNRTVRGGPLAGTKRSLAGTRTSQTYANPPRSSLASTPHLGNTNMYTPTSSWSTPGVGNTDRSRPTIYPSPSDREGMARDATKQAVSLSPDASPTVSVFHRTLVRGC